MSHSAHVQTHKKEDILQIFQRLMLRTLNLIFLVLQLTVMTIVGIIVHLFDFEIVQKTFAIILPVIILFLVGQYLTLLPTWLVFIIALVPMRFAAPILAIASIASFFILFAV